MEPIPLELWLRFVLRGDRRTLKDTSFYDRFHYTRWRDSSRIRLNRFLRSSSLAFLPIFLDMARGEITLDVLKNLFKREGSR
jgi:hypothetical protein